MKRWIAALSLTLLLGAAAPVAAGTCTDGYMKCLNDSAALWEPLRSLADVACFDDYITCVYWVFIRG
jgi:hypothetical protein